jgi:hypothetical protein
LPELDRVEHRAKPENSPNSTNAGRSPAQNEASTTGEVQRRGGSDQPGFAISFHEFYANYIPLLEDIDPSVGRFRNMVRTAVIPAAANKRQHDEAEDQLFDFYSPNQPKKKAKVHHN